jgi:uncharacterized OB-fold protein
LPFYSVYTAGIAGEKFLRGLKEDGKILGTYCSVCEIQYVPGRLYCESCFSHLDEEAWFDAGTQGLVHTYTVMHIGLDGTPLETPRIVAFVEIEGTDGGLVHYLNETDPNDVYIGMPVEAVFKPTEERQGSINDITHFRPLE